MAGKEAKNVSKPEATKPVVLFWDQTKWFEDCFSGRD
jgi:hypothetical protein